MSTSQTTSQPQTTWQPARQAPAATTSPWTEPFQAAFERQVATSQQAQSTSATRQQGAASASQSGREGTYSPNR
jgi:hypothetical protein